MPVRAATPLSLENFQLRLTSLKQAATLQCQRWKWGEANVLIGRTRALQRKLNSRLGEM